MNDPAAHPQDGLLAHAEFVRALARAALSGDSECEDVEQDVWKAALEAEPVSTARQRPWLVAVLRRKVADLLRRRERRARRERAAVAREASASAADAVVRAESGRRLVHALLVLEEPFRSAVLLRYLDGLPPREIAKRLGVPVETVRSRVRRGLERLRALLAEREQGEDRARGALLVLAGPDPAIPNFIPLLGGALVAKKITLAALVLFLLVGGTWLAVEGPSPRTEDDASSVPRAAVGSGGVESAAVLKAAARSAPSGTPLPVTSAPAPTVDPNLRPIRGRVVGEGGAPVAGAVVTGFAYGDRLGGPLLTRPDAVVWPVVATDGDGRFEIDFPVGVRNYMTLQVSAKGWCLPTSPGWAGIPASAGQDVKITLKPAVSLDVLVLDDASGAPIVGARVATYRTRGYILYMAPADVEATTGPDGHAALEVLGGATRVLATAVGYAQRESESQSVGPSGSAASIRLKKGGTVVVDVVDPAGRLVSGAHVGLLHAPAVHLRGTTDANGRIRFEDVPAKAADLSGHDALSVTLVAADADGYVRSWAEAGSPTAGSELLVRVVLMAPKTLRGRVRFADGAPAPDTGVSATVAVGRGDVWGWSGRGLPVSAKTDAAGQFELAGVSPGHVTVSAGPPASDDSALRIDVPVEGETPPLEILLARPLPPVRVRVVGADGLPVVGAAVSLLYGGPGGVQSHASFLTRAEGTVDLQPRSPSPWWLYVEGPGIGPVARQLDAAEAARGVVEVRPGAGRIEGVALRLDGSPARVKLGLQLTVHLTNLNMRQTGYRGAVEPDAQGRFVFTGVFDGVDAIGSAVEGWSVLPTPEVVVNANSRGLRLTLVNEAESASLHLVLQVVDAATGAALEIPLDVQISREGLAEIQYAHPVIGSPSNYRTAGPLAPGTWHVRIEAPGYERAETDVTLAAGREEQHHRVLLRKKP